MDKNLSVIVGYIMYYDLVQLNGSFFSKIDKAIELGQDFISQHTLDEENNWANRDFEETLEKFINDKYNS